MKSILGGAMGIIELAKVASWLYDALDDGKGETVAEQRDRARHDLDQLQLRFERVEHERGEARVLLKESREAFGALSRQMSDGGLPRYRSVPRHTDSDETRVALRNAKTRADVAERSTHRRRLALRNMDRINKERIEALAILREIATLPIVCSHVNGERLRPEADPFARGRALVQRGDSWKVGAGGSETRGPVLVVPVASGSAVPSTSESRASVGPERCVDCARQGEAAGGCSCSSSTEATRPGVAPVLADNAQEAARLLAALEDSRNGMTPRPARVR